jgi:hypothetical protein
VVTSPVFQLVEYDDEERLQEIRGVLNEAILFYSKNEGIFHEKGKFIRPGTKEHGFKHVINFP